MTLPSPFFQKNEVNTVPIQNTEQNKLKQPEPVKRNFVSYCKYCQVGFSNDTELFNHRRSHAKCPFDECKFNANEPTIALHIQRVHLKQNTLVKIQDLTTPEQIEKWREERRKRYPTTQNVILRQQIQEEKQKRGEKLHDSKKRFGDHQQRDFVKNLGRKQQNKNQGNKHRNKSNKRSNHQNGTVEKMNIESASQKLVESDETHKILTSRTVERLGREINEKKYTQNFKKPQPIKVFNNESSDEEMPKVPKFQGTSKMKEYHTVESSVKEKPALSLLGMYGSDSEEDSYSNDENSEQTGEAPKTEKFTVNQDANFEHTKQQTIQESVDNLASQENDKNENSQFLENDNDDDAPEEIPTVIQVETDQPDESLSQKSRKRKRANEKQHEKLRPKVVRKSGLDYSKLKNRSVNPFLEKLLERDIVHERNVLLQCVNFVVKSKFFGIGQNSAESAINQDTKSHQN